jgi:hypothetical protein
MKHAVFSFAVITVFALCGISCDDPLPVYTEPDKVIELNIYPQERIINYRHNDVNDVNLIQPTFAPQGLNILIEAKSIYDDALQGEIEVQGRIIIMVGKDTSTKTTVNITRFNLTSAQMVSGNVLTIVSGQSVWFKVNWYYRMDNGIWVFTKIPYTPGGNGGRTVWLDYKPQQFTMKAQLKLFKKSSYFYKEIDPILEFFGTIIMPP